MAGTILQNNSSLKTVTGVDVAALVSGGIDSAVKLGLLLRQGYKPERIKAYRFKLWAPEPEEKTECQERKEMIDAKEVADHFGIEFFPLYWESLVYDSIFGPTFEDYFSGITPNPDLGCNEKIKFGVFSDFAFNKLNASYIATGHHVRVRHDPFRLMRGKDPEKDQSYFLGTTKWEVLSRCKFPVGEYLKADEVRVMAREFGIPERILNKRSSRDWCFVAKRESEKENDPSKFTLEELLVREGKKREIEFRPGPILDERGRVVGTHNGVMLYSTTIGQKIGFKDGFGVEGGKGRTYLIKKNIPENTLHTALTQPESSEIVVHNFNWLTKSISAFPFRCEGKIRTPQNSSPCTVEKTDEGEFRVLFDRPQNSVSPGQACVLYDGETVLGGGIIVQ